MPIPPAEALGTAATDILLDTDENGSAVAVLGGLTLLLFVTMAKGSVAAAPEFCRMGWVLGEAPPLILSEVVLCGHEVALTPAQRSQS